jgi:hypothetical protein
MDWLRTIDRRSSGLRSALMGYLVRGQWLQGAGATDAAQSLGQGIVDPLRSVFGSTPTVDAQPWGLWGALRCGWEVGGAALAAAQVTPSSLVGLPMAPPALLSAAVTADVLAVLDQPGALEAHGLRQQSWEERAWLVTPAHEAAALRLASAHLGVVTSSRTLSGARADSGPEAELDVSWTPAGRVAMESRTGAVLAVLHRFCAHVWKSASAWECGCLYAAASAAEAAARLQETAAPDGAAAAAGGAGAAPPGEEDQAAGEWHVRGSRARRRRLRRIGGAAGVAMADADAARAPPGAAAAAAAAVAERARQRMRQKQAPPPSQAWLKEHNPMAAQVNWMTFVAPLTPLKVKAAALLGADPRREAEWARLEDEPFEVDAFLARADGDLIRLNTTDMFDWLGEELNAPDDAMLRAMQPPPPRAPRPARWPHDAMPPLHEHLGRAFDDGFRHHAHAVVLGPFRRVVHASPWIVWAVPPATVAARVAGDHVVCALREFAAGGAAARSTLDVPARVACLRLVLPGPLLSPPCGGAAAFERVAALMTEIEADEAPSAFTPDVVELALAPAQPARRPALWAGLVAALQRVCDATALAACAGVPGPVITAALNSGIQAALRFAQGKL